VIGNARAVIYSNGSIEWTADPALHTQITALSAEKKVLARQLYKTALQASRNAGVQLGRQRIVDNRFNQLFFQDEANPLSMNVVSLGNYIGKVQTPQVKRCMQIGRGVGFVASLLGAYLGYRIFFKSRVWQWHKPAYGIVGLLPLSYIAAQLITASKLLIGGLANAV
jgi:hypothetical protein